MNDPDRPLMQLLEQKLGRLAMAWRSNNHLPHAEQYVHQYHAVLNCLFVLGWRGRLDFENMLPDDLMPENYQDRWED